MPEPLWLSRGTAAQLQAGHNRYELYLSKAGENGRKGGGCERSLIFPSKDKASIHPCRVYFI